MKPRAGVLETSFERKLQGRGARSSRSLHHSNIRIISVPEATADSVLADLRKDPDIEFAERDYLAKAAYLPNDPYFEAGTEWHLFKIQAAQAWNFTTGLTNTIVAVLDSGIDAAHPDLAGQALSGYDFVNNNNDPADDFGHGTAVAGVVAAAGNNGLGVAGVAYAARVLPVKVMDSSGFASYSCIAQGIRYAVEQGARVINISIAGSSASATLQDAIDDAWSNNVVIVAAAGNTANDTPQYPAACDHVIGVSATEPDDSAAWFSSYGAAVTLAAPGDGIWTTQEDPSNPYGSWRGTSFSSPIVAGVAALALSENPTLSNTQLVSILEQTADKIGSAAFSTTFGYGRVNAASAVIAASVEPGATPVTVNPAPGVILSSPASSAQFSLGETVPIEATVVSGVSGAAITNVVLMADGQPFASLGTPPFVSDWSAPTEGVFMLSALAMDDQGMSATSAPVLVNIVDPDTNAPQVSLTRSPANRSRLPSPEVSLAGTASDSSGIDHVELLVNGIQDVRASGTTNWNAVLALAPGKNLVLVRSVNVAGVESPALTRTFTYVVRVPLAMRVSGAGRVSPDLDGKLLEIGRQYTVKAVPGAGQAFAGWNGALAQSRMLNFVMQSNLVLEAAFVPSPFPSVKGGYAGLMANTNGVLPDNSGCFRLAVTDSGLFTGKLFVGGKGRAFRGMFDLAGNTAVVINQGKTHPLALQFRVDLTNGTGEVSGMATDGGWASELEGGRNVFNARTNPPPQTGRCAFVLQQAAESSIPAASGVSFTSRSGRTRVHGRLEDGRAFSIGSLLNPNGNFPFCLSLRHGREIVIGWLNFPAAPEPAALGTVLWIRTGTNAFAATLQAASVP